MRSAGRRRYRPRCAHNKRFGWLDFSMRRRPRIYRNRTLVDIPEKGYSGYVSLIVGGYSDGY